MPDIVSPEVRSRMMAGIKNRNTRPELVLRSGLHRRGFRFRLHSRELPGKPDLILPKYGAVIFVNGCFWHWHDCHLFKMPSTRRDFWRTKLQGNRRRDEIVKQKLLASGWRILTVWECAFKGKFRLDQEEILDKAETWITGKTPQYEVIGSQ